MAATLTFLAGFIVIALAARQIGQYFSEVRLPLVTGYLVTGIIVGPFVLNLITSEATENLEFVNEVALGLIAFSAGNELYLKEIRSRLHSIFWVTTGLVIAIYTIGTIGVLLLAEAIPFMQDMPTASRIAIAILAGTILIARSPSSAIAVINELRAKGPYTKMVLGVTVVMDVVVIVFFAINASMADVLLIGGGFDFSFAFILASELILAFLLGYGLGRLLAVILSTHVHGHLKILLVLFGGYAMFVISDRVRTFTHDEFAAEILIEPLLICLIASFVVTNYTPYRNDFADTLHVVEPMIFIAFFTLTGAELELDVVFLTWPITLALFGIRLAGVGLGTVLGGMVAGEPSNYSRVMWMSFITQAGVGLGLAKEVAVEFPEWGNEFATLIISVIVLNEIVGPPFFKAAIRRVGESHVPARAEPDTQRDALLLGIEGKTLALARQLMHHNWKVIVADTDSAQVNLVTAPDIEAHHLPDLSVESFARVITNATDALVAMLPDDPANRQACEIAYEHFGIKRLIVLVNDPSCAGQFLELGAAVVDPTSAMVNVLDRFVRVPQSAALFLRREAEYEMVQVTISDRDIIGLSLRDLRLPNDVLMLSIHRGRQSIMPRGYTTLQRNDEVTLVGSPESLAWVTRRLGY